MLTIIKQNSTFYLIFLPLLIISSIFVVPVAMALIVVGSFYFIYKEKYEYVITLFILIIVLGDNLWPMFKSYGILRIVELVLISIFSAIIVFRYDKGVDKRILYFFPFFLVSLFSSFGFSPEVASSMARAISYLLLIFSVFTYFRFVYQDRGQLLYENIIVIITVIYTVSLLGLLTPYREMFFYGSRLKGLFGNPNSMALFSIFTYPIIDIFYYPDSSIKENQIRWVKFLIIVSVILTGSRTGMASLFIYYLLRNFYTRGFTGRVFSILVGIGVVLLIFNLDVIAQYTPLKDFFRMDTLNTASGRTVVWNVALEQIKDSPWLGNGDYYYQIFFNNYQAVHHLTGALWFSVWNSYLAFMMDTGIIGLIAYLFFIFGIVKTNNNLRIVLPFLGVALLSAMFESWMVSSLNAYTTLFLFYFVIVYENKLKIREAT